MQPTQTEILKVGQKYVDKPIFEVISKPLILDVAITALFRRSALETISDLTHYKRTPLRWMKPDGVGGLNPATK